MLIELPYPPDFAIFRDRARDLLARSAAPETLIWQEAGSAERDLFGSAESALPEGGQSAASSPVRVPRRFLDLAKGAVLHSDNGRYALLYRLLWRLRAWPGLADDLADPDMVRLARLAREVRRDIHKMRAFVRFREVSDETGDPRFVAWFEPEHHILRANAAFFVARFTALHWSILTPQGSLVWDGQSLLEGPPADRRDAPAGDPTEEMWKRYYASIFNPARLKKKAMLKEMPRKYWHNMPETALIPALIAGAQARESGMVSAGASPFPAKPPATLAEIEAGIAQCRACPIGCNGTRAVAGEGSETARLMILGEQPGDNEELAGRPFIGPAGQVLDAGLKQAGIARQSAWLTNAVKHFKYASRGKHRLHQNPAAREIDLCRWWLDGERQIIRPQLILALGASAARAVIGRTPSIARERGQPIALADGAELWITTHPSYLLRLDGEAQQRERARFEDDLSQVAARLAALPGEEQIA